MDYDSTALTAWRLCPTFAPDYIGREELKVCSYEIVCKFCSNSKGVKDPKAQFCSNKCQQDFQYHAFISRWKAGHENGVTGKTSTSKHIKRYIREKYGDRCHRCGWNEKHPADGKVPLEVEHIDGDYRNNSEENLDLLCPNCHSLTMTFRNRNKGKSTRDRRFSSVGRAPYL